MAPIQGTSIISPEEEVRRLFNVCKTSKGNAGLLHEALIYAKPEDLKESELIQVCCWWLITERDPPN